jgi:hypothetical protein
VENGGAENGGRWSDYCRRTIALGATTVALGFVTILLAGFVFPVGKLFVTGESALSDVFSYSSWSLLVFDVVAAAFLARFALGLPILAVEPSAGMLVAGLALAQRGWSATLLAATLPLTAFHQIMATAMPKLTPEANGDPNFVMPTWAIALDCFDALMLDLLLFYTALVFLSARSFWYAKHERARLVPATPA